MPGRWHLLLIAAVALLGGASHDLIGELNGMMARRLDPALPEQPFAEWLRGLLPVGAVPVYRTGRCSGAEGECLVVECPVVSRARTVRLEFETESLRFRGGRLDAPDAEQPLPVETLADLPDTLTEPIRLRPVDCPEGTRGRLRENGAGVHAWCESADGRRHGPARSWYSTGRYLMSRGRYQDGERVGEWIECDRFERCRRVSYD